MQKQLQLCTHSGLWSVKWNTAQNLKISLSRVLSWELWSSPNRTPNLPKKSTSSKYQKNIRLIKNEYWMTQFWKVFCINHSLFSWRQHKLVHWLNKKKSKLLICNICVFRVRCANTTLSIKSHKLCFTNSQPSKKRITESIFRIKSKWLFILY